MSMAMDKPPGDQPPTNNDSAGIQMPQEPNASGGAPAAAGMMVPQAPEGDLESARLDAYHAMRLLDRAVAKFGKKSDVADTLLRARAILTKVAGEHEEDSEKFSDAEIKRMLLTIAGPSSPQAPMNPQGGGGKQQGQQSQGQQQQGGQPGMQ